MMPPAIGPTIHTHQFDQSFVIKAGPNHRAGFIAAPVRLAPTKMSIVIIKPIVKPAVIAKDPRSSTAAPNTAQTRKNVKIASITTALPSARPGATAGMPPLVASKAAVGKMYFNVAAAATAPNSWATM